MGRKHGGERGRHWEGIAMMRQKLSRCVSRANHMRVYRCELAVSRWMSSLLCAHILFCLCQDWMGHYNPAAVTHQ